MQSSADAALCTRCGVHPVNTERTALKAKGLCCNKCPNHGLWCSRHMVHHQCADAEPQADDKEAQKKKAARVETGRRASIKPKEPRANTPKKPAGERRDPIEAALHRVEMEFKLKAMQEQKQHDQREKNDQKANAEVDQLLRRRQSMRSPKPKCQVAGDPNTIRETTEDDKQVMAEARKNNMHVKLKTLMERPEIADKQLVASVVFKALQDANGSVVAAKRALLA